MAQLVHRSESVRGQQLLPSCSSAALLLPGSSLLRLLRHRASRSSVCRLDGPRSLGFGKLGRCGSCGVGVLGYIPVVRDRDVLCVDGEPDLTYPNGPFTRMCNRVWQGQRVTVRELKPPSHSHCRKVWGTPDLLLSEQEHCSHLHHPNLLLLMAVCLSDGLDQVRLVYERVGLGSLHTLLHRQRADSAGLDAGRAIPLLSQVCEALLFLHLQGYLHRSLTSHAVQLVGTGHIRLGNLEYLQERPGENGDGSHRATVPPVPQQLYNWLPPEIIGGLRGSYRSDLYSFCVLTQEVFTGTVPWDGAEGRTVKELMSAGRSIPLDPCIPLALQRTVRRGTSLRQRDRTLSLRDLRHVLHQQLQDRGGLGLGPRAVSGIRPEEANVRDGLGQQDGVDGGLLVGPHRDPVSSRNGGTEGEEPYYEMERSGSQTSRCTQSPGSGTQGEEPTLSSRRSGQRERGGRPTVRDRHVALWGQEAGRCGALAIEDGHCPPTSSHPLEGDGGRRPDLADLAGGVGRRMRVYSVRCGRELDPETDSSLLFCSDSEGSPGEMERQLCPSPRGEPHPALEPPETPISQPSPLPAHVPSSDMSFLSCASSIRESVSLLTRANSSLERLERRFLSGIQALEQVTSPQCHLGQLGTEGEQSLTHSCPDVTGVGETPYSVGPQDRPDPTDPTSCIPGAGELLTQGDAESRSIHTSQGRSEGLTAVDLLERWNRRRSTETPPPGDRRRPAFDLMQDMIDELKREPGTTVSRSKEASPDEPGTPTESASHQTQSGWPTESLPAVPQLGLQLPADGGPPEVGLDGDGQPARQIPPSAQPGETMVDGGDAEEESARSRS